MSGVSVSPTTRSGLSNDEGTRANAAKRLHDTRDVSGLLEMLDDPSWKVRRRVTESLAKLGAAAVEPLCQLLRSQRDDEARIAAAVDALSTSVTTDDTPIWRLAKDRSAAVAADAAQILGRRGQADSVPLLVLLMSNKDDNVAVTAIEAIGRIGGRAAVDALLELLHSDNFFRVFPAIELLGRSGDPRAVEPLAQLLERPHYKREAARALGRTGELGAVKSLARLLVDSHDSTVRLAALSLADLDARHRERYGGAAGIESMLALHSVPAMASDRLCRAITAADAKEQTAMASILGALGREEAVPYLSNLLEGPAEVAAAAARALERIGKRADDEVRRVLRERASGERLAVLPFSAKRQAIPDILQCLSDDEPQVRARAAETLARTGDPSVVRHLFPLLGDPDVRVAQAVVSAIQSLGSAETRELAMKASTSESATVRRAALRILAYFGGPGIFDVFAKALADDDARVRDVAIHGLAFVDDPRASDRLLEAMHDNREKVRAAAARALGQCTDQMKITGALMKALADRDGWVRYYACQSLGRLRHDAAAPRLATLISDQAGQVRVAAVEALSHLNGEIGFRALCEAAQSPERDIRRAALIGLGIARKDESLPVLVDAIDRGDPATRLVAVSTLGGFDDADVLPVWRRAAQDADQAVRNAAVANLATREGGAATQILVALLTSSKSEAAPLVSALSTPVKGRIPVLLAALREAGDDLAAQLTSVLARMRTPEANAALLEAFQFPNAACRKAAAPALAAVGSPEGLKAIRVAAMEDSDPQLKQICSLLMAQ